MSVITGGSQDYCYYVNKGKTNDYILHLCVRDKPFSPCIRLEKQYVFNRENGESWEQLRDRIRHAMHVFGFYGTFPGLKVYRTRKNFNLY